MSDLSGAVVLATLLYTSIGLALFGGSLWFATKVLPFSIRKEIEEDQNVALGIIIAGAFVGIAIIIGAAIGS